MMKYHSTINCDLHKSKYDCVDVLITKHANKSKPVIIIHDGGSSGISINYCPWCGKKF